MFSRKTSQEKAVDSSRARLDAVRGALAKSEAERSKAQAALDKELGALRKAKDSFEAAKASYATAKRPSDRDAKKIRASKETVELGELRCDGPRSRLLEAEQGVAVATAAVLDAEQELARAERALHLEALKKIASLAVFREETADAYKRLLVLRRELVDVCEFIDRKFQASVAASKELTLAGVDCPEAAPLDSLQLLAPLFEARVKEEPSSAYSLALALRGDLRFAVGGRSDRLGPPIPVGLGPVLLINPIDEVMMVSGAPECSGVHRDAIKRYFSDRTPRGIDACLDTPKPAA